MNNAGELAFKLTGLIYDAALDERKWVDFLEAFTFAVGSKSAILRYVDYQSSKASFAANFGFDPAWQEAYTNHFIKIDHFAAFFQNAPLNSAEHDHSSRILGISPQEQKKTEFYNDYLKVIGTEYAMGTTLARDGNQMLQFAAQRAKHAGAFGAEQVQLMNIVSPHVSRAVKMHSKLSSVTVEKEWALGALDQLRMGVILTNAVGKPLFANHAAEKMLSNDEGINTHQGKLTAAKPAETDRLYKLIADAAKGEPGANRGGDMRITQTNGEFIHCLVMPIPNEFSQRWNMPQASGCVAIFFSKPSGLQLPPKRLAILFGLTPAEGRLATKLAALKSVEQAADDLCISINTARSQLKSVFAKTGAKCQSELLILLSTGTLAHCHHAINEYD